MLSRKAEKMMNRMIALTLPAIMALSPFAAWANSETGGYHGHGHMWGGGWGMIAGPLVMILIIAAVVVTVVLVLRWMGGPASRAGGYGPAGKSPEDILKERYAQGEIDTKEFEERRKILGD